MTLYFRIIDIFIVFGMNQAHSIADFIMSDKGATYVNTSKIGLAVAAEVHKTRESFLYYYFSL